MLVRINILKIGRIVRLVLILDGIVLLLKVFLEVLHIHEQGVL